MEAMVPLFLVSLVVGLAVGVLAGLLGIGGGMLLVPAFKLGYAMDSLMCTATSLFTIIPTSVSGAISHIRNKTCLPKLGRGRGPRGRLPVAFRGVARHSLAGLGRHGSGGAHHRLLFRYDVPQSAEGSEGTSGRWGRCRGCGGKGSCCRGSCRRHRTGACGGPDDRLARGGHRGCYRTFRRSRLGLRGRGRRFYHGAAYDVHPACSHEAHFGHVAYRRHDPRRAGHGDPKRCSATSTGSPASPWPAAPSPEQPWARSSSRRCPSASCASCSPASSWWPPSCSS